MMDSYAMRKHQPASTASRWPMSAVVVAAMAIVVITVGACGSPATSTDTSSSPTPTSNEPAGQPGSTTTGPTPPEADTGGNPAAGDNSDQAPLPQPLQIEVTTSSPTASYPCQPSGTIVVSGGSDDGDSTQVPDSAEYPLEVTYQWFVQESSPAQSPVPAGPPKTLQFNVAGGIPVSGPELNPAPGLKIELRVVAPETIPGGWITHSGCV